MNEIVTVRGYSSLEAQFLMREVVYMRTNDAECGGWCSRPKTFTFVLSDGSEITGTEYTIREAE